MASRSCWSSGSQSSRALARPRLDVLAAALVVLLGALAVPATARGERFESLVLGPELRVRARDGALTPPRYEVLLPHGLHAAHGEVIARMGLVLPSSRGDSLAFPLTVGVRYLPFEGALRPLLGADLGGYFTFDRSTDQADQGRAERSHADWAWSVRALVGAQLSFTRHVALRLYGDAQWSAPHAYAQVGALFATGLGLGCELAFTFSGPRLALLDMLVHGKDAPEGW